MKKAIIGITSAIVVAVSVLLLFEGTVIESTAAKHNGIHYNYKDGEAHVVGCDSSLTVVEIPETVDGYPVTTIAYDAFGSKNNLKSVRISNSVTTIGKIAFYGCYNLTDIYIPSSVKTIGREAFAYCDILTNVYYNAVDVESNPGDAFSSSGTRGEGLKITIGKDVKHIPDRLFSMPSPSRSEIRMEVVFEEGSVCESIGIGAFGGREKLISITIPPSVKSIGKSAFAFCSRLKTIEFLGDAPSFNNNTFYGITATAYYDSSLEGWTEAISRGYGGWITWVSTNKHSYGPWSLVKAPGCEEKGTETRTCTECSETDTREVAATGHTFDDWAETKKPDCVNKGSESHSCSVCKKIETRDIDALGHDFDAPTVTKAPTCTETGTESGKCKRCSEETTNTIPAKGHEFENYTLIKEPTCTEQGTRKGTCVVCGATATEIIPAKGHAYDGGVVEKEATENEEGTKLYTCTVCKNEKRETIEKVTAQTTSVPDTTEVPYTTESPETNEPVETTVKPDESRTTDFSESDTIEASSDTDASDSPKKEKNSGVVIAVAVSVLVAIVVVGIAVLNRKK